MQVPAGKPLRFQPGSRFGPATGKWTNWTGSLCYQLQDLIQKVRQGYDRFEFHRVYHALHNYCVVDLSSFYLDILKDRLYTSPAASVARRSAQTVIHTVLKTIVRLMAPILSFTAEEVWLRMPHGPGPSVHMEAFPEVDSNLRDEELERAGGKKSWR